MQEAFMDSAHSLLRFRTGPTQPHLYNEAGCVAWGPNLMSLQVPEIAMLGSKHPIFPASVESPKLHT